MHALLLEPSYYTQYPPLGLLKISTYHKMKGDTVQYLRGTSRLRFLYNHPDRIYITSLFTWAWKPVEKAVRLARTFFPGSEIWLGGIYASLMPDHAGRHGADRVFAGIWNELEGLLPDYSLVPKWHQKQKASILFSHRGCIRNCPYCAVPALEGKPFRYCEDISIRPLIHPEHKKIILWDNNILGEPHWKSVVHEIKDLKLQVDFNQGLDARLITEEVALSFRGLSMPIIRVAYDNIGMRKAVKNAIELLESVGFPRRNVVSYVLFNFKDTPEQLFDRVRDLLSWGASAYPMRFQPLDSLEKDSYIAPKWTKRELDMVAQARRVFGSGGAFPPYEGLVNKFLEAKDFSDAFSVWPEKSTQGKDRKANVPEPKTIIFRNYSVTAQKSRTTDRNNTDKPIETFIASSPEALGGKHALLVSSKGKVKKASLLGIYRTVDGEQKISLDKGEKIVSVQPDYRNEDILCIVSRHGRLGAFLTKTVGSRTLEAPLAKRLEIDKKDEVFSAFCTDSGKMLLAVNKSGWVKILPVDQLYTYRNSGRGTVLDFPNKRLTQLQYAAPINGGRLTIQITTNNGRRIQRTLEVRDRMPEYKDAFRLVELRRQEFVRRVKIIDNR